MTERMTDMENDRLSISRLPVTDGNSCVENGDQFCGVGCRTTHLMGDFYLCLTDRDGCEHAFAYEYSHLCRSPRRQVYSKRLP